MFKLSIITINYNNLKGLQRTVESVINQSWKEFEYIIIDGGSTDGSKEYLESKKEYLDFCISQPDKGIYNAMNKGISNATGEYLLFLNSGDHLFYKDALKKNKDLLIDYDLIYFDLQVVNQAEFYINKYPEELRFSDLYYGSLPHPATFIKKELFKKIGLYDEDLKIVSDWKFFLLALFQFNCTYKKGNDTFATFYLDGVSSDYNNKKKLIAERQKVLHHYFAPFLLDYEELNSARIYTGMNRYKMLIEIEKTNIGRKIVSFFFRFYIVLFLKKNVKEITDRNPKNLF
ncbi:glycosyltransferase family 2 protein [Flavobacterium restrictum]|uniref:Glycosyltransferase n=1 Tax=Flavobacterium restrictum TaxID=2594428 RepID=A0A553E846_9FLAO|nr:glycosyltransferase family 2 protein [Flavobacterium restrictum]TRX41244.1 glycosyltransferase [Flavobacterium restrictum]